MKEMFKKISELLRQTPGKSCQDQLKKRIELSPFKVADFTDSLEPECNQCYTDMLIQVVHGVEKRFKTPHKHKDSRVGKRSVSAAVPIISLLAECETSQNYVCLFLFPFAFMK